MDHINKRKVALGFCIRKNVPLKKMGLRVRRGKIDVLFASSSLDHFQNLLNNL